MRPIDYGKHVIAGLSVATIIATSSSAYALSIDLSRVPKRLGNAITRIVGAIPVAGENLKAGYKEARETKGIRGSVSALAKGVQGATLDTAREVRMLGSVETPLACR